MDLDGRLIMLLVWGAGTVAAASRVLRDRVFAWRRHHDIRSWRELVSGISLFITSWAAAASVVIVLFGEAGTNLRGFLIALALGAYAAMVVSMAFDSWQEDKADLAMARRGETDAR